MIKKLSTLVVIALVAGAFWYASNAAKNDPATLGKPLVDISMPVLTGVAAEGQVIFNGACAACHGQNARGLGGSGPTLVQKIYAPKRHGDGAFLLAARGGVRAHHWNFGSMPPFEGITDAEVIKVVAFVRALQVENGIK